MTASALVQAAKMQSKCGNAGYSCIGTWQEKTVSRPDKVKLVILQDELS